MKHLSKREDFLKRTKHSKIVNIINEEAGGPFTNDIPWGDSLVGRLINSFIRKAKIGYGSTKIKPLIESFKNQLDILISGALSKDTLTKFNLLQLKALFHNIKQVCTNSISDEQKLDQLIGGHQDLWDQTQQNAGAWKNVLSGGLVPDCYEYIETKIDKKILEDAGISRDKLLDEVSIFIDNLRRLTDVDAVPLQQQQGNNGFAQLFGNLVNRFSVINESLDNNFGDMILEKMSIDDLKANVKKREEDLSKMPKDDPGRSAMENELNNAKRVLNKRLGTENNTNANTNTNTSSNPNAVAKTGGLVTTDGKKEGEQSGSKTETGVAVVNKTETGLATTDKGETGLALTTDDTNDKIKKIKELAIKCKAKGFETTEEILKDGDAVGFIKGVATLNQGDLDYIKRKNPKEEGFTTDISEFNGSEDAKNVVVKNEPKEEPKQGEPKQAEPKQGEPTKQNSSYVYLYEATGTPGSTSSTPGGTSSTIRSTVIDCWNKFVTEARIPAEMVNITQREIDELEKLTTDNVNGTLTYDLSTNPDPIIAICRIFKRANEIYFTPVIPSGRSGGKVSNKTFLEYEKLGGAASGSSDAASPGYGPWAVKKLRNDWTDGVLAVLEDQKYRKVLANIKFIVPGSEDNFNRTAESFIKRYDRFMKVYEAETTTDSPAGGQLGVDKKSHGQILFDFINDLLDNKTAANFDEQRRILLKKYFEPYGLKVTTDKGKTPTPIVRQPECDPKTIFWSPISSFTNPNIQTQKGKFYAIPIVKVGPGNHDMIFLQLLKKITPPPGINVECYYTKFVFDNQAIVTKYKEGKHPDYNVTTDWSTQANTPQNVYYGIITKMVNNKFSLFYANVANQSPDKIYGIKDGFTISTSGSKTGPNGNFAVCLSILMESATQNQSTQVDTDFCGVIKAEKNNHVDNLNIVSNDPDFNEKLLTALVKKMEKEFTNP
jgi:hypothetical protein